MAKKPWKCLSVRQPWAWAIIWGGKDVENRLWPSEYLGQLYIHAGLKEEKDKVEEAVKKVARVRGISVAEARAEYDQHLKTGLGAIIGSVYMYGCVYSCDSPWYDKKQWGFLLRDAKPLKTPIKAKGKPNFFDFTP